jgi:hypothetical protein
LTGIVLNLRLLINLGLFVKLGLPDFRDFCIQPVLGSVRPVLAL